MIVLKIYRTSKYLRKGKCEPWPPCFKLLNTEYLVAWEEVNQSWFLQRVRTCSTNHIFLPNANDILECRIKTRITLTEHEWIWLKFFIWYFLRCTVLIYHSRIRSNSGKDLRYKISFESTFLYFYWILVCSGTDFEILIWPQQVPRL